MSNRCTSSGIVGYVPISLYDERRIDAIAMVCLTILSLMLVIVVVVVAVNIIVTASKTLNAFGLVGNHDAYVHTTISFI